MDNNDASDKQVQFVDVKLAVIIIIMHEYD